MTSDKDDATATSNLAGKSSGDGKNSVSGGEKSDEKGTNGSGGDGKKDEKKDSNGNSGAKKDAGEDRLVTDDKYLSDHKNQTD